MPTVAETLSLLSRRVDPNKAASWDQHGLQIGDPDAVIRTVGVCHEVTEAVVMAAIGAEVGLLITYHPLIFQPLTRVVPGQGPGGRAFRLLRAGVAVATFHTAWDAARGGAADALASALGLRQVSGFGPLDSPPRIKLVTFVPPEHVDEVAAALSAAGAGRIGNYDSCGFRTEGTGTFFPGPGADPVVGLAGSLNFEKEIRLEMVADKRSESALLAALTTSHPYEEPAFDVYDIRANVGMAGRVGRLAERMSPTMFADLVGATLSANPRIAVGHAKFLERVAVVPGSGSSLIGAAAAADADVLITGDVSHHATVEALDQGLWVIDPGHAATERPGVATLFDAVRSFAPDAVDLTMDPTPWSLP